MIAGVRRTTPAALPGLLLPGLLLAASGAAFFATVTYLFAVMVPAGLDLGLFDDPAGLVQWSQDHRARYLGLWLLYLVVQVLLLPVPVLLGRFAPPGGLRTTARAVTAIGSGAALLALTGLCLQFALGRAAFGWDVSAGAADREVLLAVHEVIADTGKDLRLVAELLLGIWMVALGTAAWRSSVGRLGPLVAGVGVWTVIVAAWKLLDPQLGLEDWLAFLVGAVHLAWGLELAFVARRAAPEAAPEGAPGELSGELPDPVA